MQLTGNTILITGGTSGIGQAFAAYFHEAGNTVIICGRRQDRLNDMQAKYKGIITKMCDVGKAEDRRELAEWVKKEYPATNILMNNAGIQLTADMTREVELSRIHEEIGINMVAPLHLSSLFVSILNGKNNAAIINITSGLAFVPISFMPVYCGTKAALHSITLSMRHQLKDTSIKVFEIAPPSVDTELGHDRRTDKTQTHGGMPINEFLPEAIEALKNDVLEAPIAYSKKLHAEREALFTTMNP